jgi:hypothetical protein
MDMDGYNPGATVTNHVWAREIQKPQATARLTTTFPWRPFFEGRVAAEPWVWIEGKGGGGGGGGILIGETFRVVGAIKK